VNSFSWCFEGKTPTFAATKHFTTKSNNDMKKNIITMLLLAAALTLHAQDKLFLPDSLHVAVRKSAPDLYFHDQEMQRLLMPKDAEFGVESVPSFECEWTLTYSPSAHALIYKVSQENIWYKKYHFDHWDDYTHKPGEKRPKRYKSPKVNTYKLALADDQAELLRTIWRNAIGQAIDEKTMEAMTISGKHPLRVVHTDGTRWNFFLADRRAYSYFAKNPHVAFTNAQVAPRHPRDRRQARICPHEIYAPLHLQTVITALYKCVKTTSYETNHHHNHRMDGHRPQRQRHWAGGRTNCMERQRV
jgi:hypothetical protein